MNLGKFVLIWLLAVASACKEPAPTSSTVAGSTTLTHEQVSPSIYPLQIGLRDQNGTDIPLDVFRGRPVIISMFYGSCPAACPLIVSHIKQVEAALAPETRANTRVLLVSFDEERDTPDRLRTLAAAHHVDDTRWRFAVGADDQVRQLANVLGVHYRKGEGGIFSHNSVISVLDGEGRIIAHVDDPDADLAPLSEAIVVTSR